MMSGRMRLLCCFVIVLVQMVSWGCVTSRPFAPSGDHDSSHPDTEGQSPESLQVTLSSKEGNENMTRVAEMKEEAATYTGVNKIGSSPPSCDHKCFGCTPCEAIQVPTTTSRVGVQYANYEPEGWKCKCGPSFYSP